MNRNNLCRKKKDHIGKNIFVDYFQAMQDFDQSQGRKPEDIDLTLKNSVDPDGGVDYLTVSREWERYLIEDHSEVIHGEKK